MSTKANVLITLRIYSFCFVINGIIVVSWTLDTVLWTVVHLIIISIIGESTYLVGLYKYIIIEFYKCSIKFIKYFKMSL